MDCPLDGLTHVAERGWGERERERGGDGGGEREREKGGVGAERGEEENRKKKRLR